MKTGPVSNTFVPIVSESSALSPIAFAHGVRRAIIDQSKRANVGHIGSALSVADIISALYAEVLRIESPSDPLRDRFILSKGHAALALYAALQLRGWISQAELSTFCGDGSPFGVHPEHTVNGIDFSTGSLGQGLSVATGMALAARLHDSKHRVFALLSDAECNEGSVWEAIMFAAHHKLSNLVVIVDLNGQQAFGHTKNVLDLSPMSARWQTFGWDVSEVDGHDVSQIADTLGGLNYEFGPPHVVVAKTTFGKGVSYMENQIRWHYSPMSDDDYRIAIEELEAAR